MNGINYFNALPSEVKTMIFRNVDFWGRFQCKKVSFEWKNLIDSDPLLKDDGQILESIAVGGFNKDGYPEKVWLKKGFKASSGRFRYAGIFKDVTLLKMDCDKRGKHKSHSAEFGHEIYTLCPKVKTVVIVDCKFGLKRNTWNLIEALCPKLERIVVRIREGQTLTPRKISNVSFTFFIQVRLESSDYVAFAMGAREIVLKEIFDNQHTVIKRDVNVTRNELTLDFRAREQHFYEICNKFIVLSLILLILSFVLERINKNC